jgi:chitodextrinase
VAARAARHRGFALASADDVTFQSSKHIYFAIKDISQNPSDLRRINPSLTGAMAGKGRDYVANPSLYYDYSVDVKNLPYIKRIDYVLPGAAETTPPVVPPVTPPVGDTTPPSAPAGLTVTPVSPAQVNLAWIASTDDVGVAGYRVVRDGSAIATVAATTYQDTAVAPATSYSYAVTAFDAAGNGAASAPVSILTPQALAMSDVDASKVSSSGATITWVTNAPSTSQVVYGTADYTMRKVDNRLVTNHTVTLSKLSAATTYRFQVVSTDERNSTVRSADMALTTLAKARNKAGRAVESEEGASGQWTTLFLPIVAIIAIVAIIVILAYPWRHEKRR